MRRVYRVFLVAAILFCLPTFSHAQNVGIRFPGFLEFNTLGGGARAAGMGGAYLGIAEGEMAYSWNPAAMIYTDKTKIGIQLVSIADKFSSVSIQENYYLYPEPNIQPTEIEKGHFSLNFGGFTAPFTFMEREWAIGGGYRNVFDMVTEYETPGFAGTTNSLAQDRGVDAISVAIAHKVMEGVGIGLTGNAYIRNSEYNYYEGAAYLFITAGQDTSIVDAWNNFNSHFSGFNLDLGISADFGMIKGGAVIHTPYDLKQDGKWIFSIVIPPEPIGFVDRVKYTYNMPLSYSIGIGVVPVENFTLAFDFDGRPLSDVDVHTDWEQIIIPDTTFNLGWEDVNQFRVGAEYILDADFADIPVRTGFRNAPSIGKQTLEIVREISGPDTTYAFTEGDQITTSIFTFGTGLYFERVWFDVAYQFGTSSYDCTVDFGTPTVYEMKQDYSRLFISAGMYF